ncbi:MAG: SufS family cysteine desulfurase [Nanoarchaeota archaeon]
MEKIELINYFKNKRLDFPILNQTIKNHKLVYVDNGASTQKPQQVINSIVDIYENYYSNIHRGVHTLSESCTEKYEDVRNKAAKFINASRDEIIFTKGTTHGLNMTAFGLKHLLKENDEIILSDMEHHANLVPWQEIAKEKNLKLKFIKRNKDFSINLEHLKDIITNKTKIVSIPHISNVLGVINNIKKIEKITHNKGAYLIIDGAQSLPHMKIDVKKLNCDILSFSSHKMCGPSGVGILYGKKKILEKLKPFEYGGDMINEVNLQHSTYNKIPYRFEAGTPNIEGVIGFGSAIDYLNEITMDKIEKYENILTEHFLEKIKKLNNIQIHGPLKSKNRASVFSFTVKNIHPHDVSTILDQKGIAIRGGHHCAMPLTKTLGVCATCRISFYFYNTIEEIDYIIQVLSQINDIFKNKAFTF